MMKEIVFEQLKNAMRNKDTLSKGVLTLLKAGLDAAAKEKGQVLSPTEEYAVVNREIKQVRQSIEGAEKANREDIIQNEKRKLELLETFLPKQLNEVEVHNTLTSAGLYSGMTMKEAMSIAKPILAGLADNALTAKVVKDIISNG